SSGKKLRDKAKELAVKELTLIIAEESKKAARQQRESRLDTKEPGHSSDFTNDFFELQASYQVAAYSMRVTKQPTLYTKYKEAPQDFWENWGNYPESRELSQLARSYLSIQATSSESERLFSKAGRLLSARRTQMGDETFRNIIFASSYNK
ncbi:hypothetical protein BGZ52_008406, partial [Haplosporangium bisporale]